nr:MAG TPA: hypothetical protein [Caudoviricetes sp.]
MMRNRRGPRLHEGQHLCAIIYHSLNKGYKHEQFEC